MVKGQDRGKLFSSWQPGNRDGGGRDKIEPPRACSQGPTSSNRAPLVYSVHRLPVVHSALNGFSH